MRQKIKPLLHRRLRRDVKTRIYIVILFYRLSTISGPRPGSVVLTSGTGECEVGRVYIIKYQSKYISHRCAACVNVLCIMYTRLTKQSKVKTVYNSGVVMYRI